MGGREAAPHWYFAEFGFFWAANQQVLAQINQATSAINFFVHMPDCPHVPVTYILKSVAYDVAIGKPKHLVLVLGT